MADQLQRGDVVWITFPSAEPENNMIAGPHMAAVVTVQSKIAQVVPITSLVNAAGVQKPLRPTDLLLRAEDHPFLRHDSILKGHQLQATPLLWLDKTSAGQVKVIGRVHPTLEKSFALMLIKALGLHDFVQQLLKERDLKRPIPERPERTHDPKRTPHKR